MAVLDWLFGFVLFFSMLVGAWRGLVFEVLSLLSWLAAFVVAPFFSHAAGQWLPMQGADLWWRDAAGFALVFVATVMLGSLLATVVKKLMTSVGLRPADRAFGALFGLLRGVLLLLAGVVLVGLTPLKTSPQWQQSTGVSWSLTLIRGIQPVLPRELLKFLPECVAC